MRYRSKLTLLLATLVVLSNGALVALSYQFTYDLLVDEIASKVLSIAATAATFTDGDLHQTIVNPGDEQTPAYQKLRQQLRNARDANRRADAHIRYIYTMVEGPTPTSPWRYVVDAEEEGSENRSRIGDPIEYDLVVGEQEARMTEQTVEELVVDDFGAWMSASTPIRNSKGEVVASLGVDLSASVVQQKTRQLLARGYLAMAVVVVAVAGAAFYFARLVTRPLDALTQMARKVGEGDLQAHVEPTTKDEFGKLGHAFNDMAKGLRERVLLRHTLARYLSYHVADEIIESGKLPELRGQRKRITIFFLDIRDFTSFAEGNEPEAVVERLNQIFEIMIQAIYSRRGTLDKFLGDGLMAIFGAPLQDDEHALNAVRAAVEIYNRIAELNKRWKTNGERAFHLGIGIHTGDAVVGNIGSDDRMEYTAIGDTVNFAERVQSRTKHYDGTIFVSQDTYPHVKDHVGAVDVGQITSGTRTEHVYAIHALDGEDLPPID